MNEIAVTKPHELSVEGLKHQACMLEYAMKLAECYCRTALVPKLYQGKPNAGAVAIQWGAELGMQPLQSLQNIAVINGNPTVWGDALVALVRRAPCCKFIHVEYDDEKMTATVSTQRDDQPIETSTYSMADATRAKLANRDTYKMHPKRMLVNRARAHLLRDVYADLLKGFNIREVAEEDFENMKDVTPTTESETLNELIETQKPESDYIQDEILKAETQEEMLAVKEKIIALGEGQYQDEMKACYVARIEHLKGLKTNG